MLKLINFNAVNNEHHLVLSVSGLFGGVDVCQPEYISTMY